MDSLSAYDRFVAALWFVVCPWKHLQPPVNDAWEPHESVQRAAHARAAKKASSGAV